MNKIALSGIVVAGLASAALAQTPVYTFEHRLIPDGAAGAPTGAWTQFAIGNPAAVTATRIGFWLQARVSQTGGTNYGIGRAGNGATPNASFISTSDAGSTLARGAINAGGTQHGRGTGYRNGGSNVGETGNAAGSAAYPGSANNQNGGLDSGNRRIYGFDSYVGATRNGVDDGEGNFSNPWGVNGGAAGAAVPTGEFSPWANLYRFYVDIGTNNGQTVVLNYTVQLNGTLQTQDVGGGLFPLQLGAAQLVNGSYTFTMVPTPGAAAVLGLGGLVAARRRR